MLLHTIGHSTRSFEEFVEILTAYDIRHLVDVRSIPKSARMPWFNQQVLAKTLREKGIIYLHLPLLGGRRSADKHSQNMAWKNAAFRGYADYMQTKDFEQSLNELNHLLRARAGVSIMCAEAVPWRCHRSLISDAELARGIEVRHILSKTHSQPHRLTPFALVEKEGGHIRLTYPAAKEAATSQQQTLDLGLE